MGFGLERGSRIQHNKSSPYNLLQPQPTMLNPESRKCKNSRTCEPKRTKSQALQQRHFNPHFHTDAKTMFRQATLSVDFQYKPSKPLKPKPLSLRFYALRHQNPTNPKHTHQPLPQKLAVGEVTCPEGANGCHAMSKPKEAFPPLKVCRIRAFYGCWAMILHTFGGVGCFGVRDSSLQFRVLG